MVNWRLVTTPRHLGGLGVRNIHAANQALLMRWMWQWHASNAAWWKSNTLMAHPVQRPWNDANGTPFWKQIKSIEPIFTCSVTHQIGNGATTSFWHDNWQDGVLKSMFPTLYHELPAKGLSVSECVNDNAWYLHLPPLTHRAQMEKDLLFSRLQQIQVPQSHEPDSVTWCRHPTTFSTATAYSFITDTPRPTNIIRNIWQIKAPFRVQIFAWLMLSNRLTTLDNLSRRGWTLPNMCIMCKADAETTQHLFHHCSLAVQIRTYIHSALSPQCFLAHKFIMPDSARMLTDPLEQMMNRNWEITTCYVLWRERCRRIFSEKFESHMSLVREIKMEIRNWYPH